MSLPCSVIEEARASELAYGWVKRLCRTGSVRREKRAAHKAERKDADAQIELGGCRRFCV
ncbi:hypothetical protein CMV30_03405 [Nibricoccus aquaticus]|uniref:Uncharacterized protein n=1 Tax=Nibricoccus aquaticus TaxID=2576891 RepID=A0A290QCM0_9BACT|nr:hypothetical protein CMV30_03405 [Nibricoccus aquaticus]